MKFDDILIDSNFVLRHPAFYLATLVLAILPHFVVDYQTCFLVAQQSNPDINLLNFVQHVLVEKFALCIVMTSIIFGCVYLSGSWQKNMNASQVPKSVLSYIKVALVIMPTGFLFYGILHTIILNFFPSHHGALTQIQYLHMVIFHAVHFSILYLILLSSIVLKSVLNAPNKKLQVLDTKGRCFIPWTSIDWVLKENGVYELKTKDGRYRTEHPINYFERRLESRYYVRINRAAIVRTSLINGYNYWEHDKYILRVGSEEKEFVVSRQRMKTIRNQLAFET